MGASVSNYPASLDTSAEFPDPTSTQQDGDGNANRVHSTLHNSLADAVIQLETRLGVTGAFNANRAATKLVAGANASAAVRALADFVCAGSADDVDIQAAFDALTIGRDWVETVKCVGDFSMNSHVELSPFSRLDATEARFEVQDNPGSGTMFRNKNRSQPGFDEHIHILGGVYNGRYAGGSTNEPITLVRVSRWSIKDAEVFGSSGNGITIEGVATGEGGTGENAEQGREGVLDNIFTHDNAGIGLYVRRAARDIFIDRVVATHNGSHGIMVDASEVTIGTIRCTWNKQRGFYFTNGHSCSFNTIVATRNGEHGVFFRGFVRSGGSTIIATGNGMSAADTYDEVHFDHTAGTHGPNKNVVIGQIITEMTDNLDGSPVGLWANLNQPWLKWTASGSGTNEYYLTRIGGGDPEYIEPNNVYDDPTADYAAGALGAGTAGSLSAAEWDWADNDSLGFSTIYVRLSDGSGPVGSVMIARGYNFLQQARYSLYFTESNDGDPNSEGGTTTNNSDKILINGAWLGTGDTGMIREPPNQGLRGVNINVMGASDDHPYLYKKEASGTGSIASGGTTDVITHGLDLAPALKDIAVTLGENPTNDPGNIWVDAIGATQFTVNCRNDPGASNLDFAWAVRIRN